MFNSCVRRPRNSAVVTLENCVVTGNATTQNSEGGGIFNFGTLNVAATVIAGNAADADGGGIFTVGTLNLTNSTVAANTAKGNGGGICQYVDTAAAAINNTIVALNTASVANDLFNVEGAVSGAHNLISNGSDQTEFIDAADGKVNSDDLNVIRANWGLTARFRLHAAAADAYYRGLG